MVRGAWSGRVVGAASNGMHCEPITWYDLAQGRSRPRKEIELAQGEGPGIMVFAGLPFPQILLLARGYFLTAKLSADATCEEVEAAILRAANFFAAPGAQVPFIPVLAGPVHDSERIPGLGRIPHIDPERAASIAITNAPHDPTDRQGREDSPFHQPYEEWGVSDCDRPEALPVTVVVGSPENGDAIWIGAVSRDDPLWKGLRNTPLAAEYGRQGQ